MTISGQFIIQCSKCKTQITFNPEDTDFEKESEEEGPMGNRNYYRWEENTNCPNCDNEITIAYEVWEYPQGAFEDENIDLDGVLSPPIQKFNFDFQDSLFDGSDIDEYEPDFEEE